MGKKQKKEQIKVESIGNSCSGVTGSSWMVTYPKKNGNNGKFLIVLGMVQKNGRLLEEYKINKSIIDSVPYKDIEFVVLCHNHGDHILNIPALYNKGFDGKVITTHENKKLAHELYLDGAYILDRNCSVLQHKGYSTKPHYTESDVHITTHNTIVKPKNEIFEMNEYVSMRFRGNSHVIGANQLEIFIKTPSGKIRKIFYSSDLGSNKNFKHRYFLNNNELVSNSNLCIMEATYNSESRVFTKDEAIHERKSMLKMIKRQMKQGNSVIISSFAFSRSQDLLMWLYDNLNGNDCMEKAMVVLDGKLVHKINNVYLDILNEDDKKKFKEVLQWDKLKLVKDYKESITIANRDDVGKIVIAGSGMGHIGRILNYMKVSLKRKNDVIAFIGYTAEGLIGDMIKNPKYKSIKIENVEYHKLCKVRNYKTWSSHIQSDEIINYLKQHNTDRIVLHHSDDNKYAFAKQIKEEMYKIGKTTRISVADENNKIFYI